MWQCVYFVRYQGYIGAALVLGGVDCNGPHLYSIYPHGSTDKLPYVTMGQSQTQHTMTVSSFSSFGNILIDYLIIDNVFQIFHFQSLHWSQSTNFDLGVSRDPFFFKFHRFATDDYIDIY